MVIIENGISIVCRIVDYFKSNYYKNNYIL